MIIRTWNNDSYPGKISHMANRKSPIWPMYGENECCIMTEDQAAAACLGKLPLDKTRNLGYNLT
jgi:hypothetical protein